MFIVLYRWKLKVGQEARFQEGWLRRTREIYQEGGSLGSRLHRAEDGTWYAYAQWPDKKTWEAERTVRDQEARTMMLESIESSFPYVCMEAMADLLASTPAKPPPKPTS